MCTQLCKIALRPPSLQILLAHEVARYETWVPFASYEAQFASKEYPVGMMRLLSGRVRRSCGLLVVACSLGPSGCTQAAAQATSLKGTAGTVSVLGQLSPLRLDQVSGVSLKDGRLVARGSFENVAIELPAFVDTAQVVRHWALVTESSLDDKKVLNFTHDQSLDDFTIEVPATEAESATVSSRTVAAAR